MGRKKSRVKVMAGFSQETVALLRAKEPTREMVVKSFSRTPSSGIFFVRSKSGPEISHLGCLNWQLQGISLALVGVVENPVVELRRPSWIPFT